MLRNINFYYLKYCTPGRKNIQGVYLYTVYYDSVAVHSLATNLATYEPPIEWIAD